MQPVAGKPTIGEKIKSKIPGTAEHAMTHPQTAANTGVGGGMGTGGMGTTGMGTTGMGGGMAPAAGGYGNQGMANTGMGGGMGAGGVAGGQAHGSAPHGESRAEYAVKSAIPGQPEHIERHGYTPNDAKAQNVVQQVKAHLPGTREHEAHKAMQGRAPY